MKYYLIAGEASGDVHASHLIAAIRQQDAAARFRCYGGDMMAAQGAELVRHYRDLAYMGFLTVLRHLPTILRGMRHCQKDILEWKPDVLILVDYPGFNLRIASFIKQHSSIPVVYYIAPKIWAWKEHRIRSIKQGVDCLLSILPFEVPYYQEKHHYPIYYVGNPTVDEVEAYLREHPSEEQGAGSKEQGTTQPVIALLPGSRRQEVSSNLPIMLKAAEPYAADSRIIVAAAPGLEDEFYEKCIKMADGEWLNGKCTVVRDQTLQLLQHSTAALVTSGTATLETALLRVPQVVCYRTKAGRLVSLAKRLFLKVPYISLVNLIAGEEVVPELVGHQMNIANVRRHLTSILPGGQEREAQLKGYERMARLLSGPGAPDRAAKIILDVTKDK